MAYKAHEYARCLKGNNKCGSDNIQFSCWTDRAFGSDSDILDAMGFNPSSGGVASSDSENLRFIRSMISLLQLAHGLLRNGSPRLRSYRSR